MTRRALFSKRFWADATERAAKTFGQVGAASIGAAAVFSEIRWDVVSATVGGAVLLSLLTSLGSLEVGEAGTASLLPPPPPPPH